jgi:hypothetical protein
MDSRALTPPAEHITTTTLAARRQPHPGRAGKPNHGRTRAAPTRGTTPAQQDGPPTHPLPRGSCRPEPSRRQPAQAQHAAPCGHSLPRPVPCGHRQDPHTPSTVRRPVLGHTVLAGISIAARLRHYDTMQVPLCVPFVATGRPQPAAPPRTASPPGPRATPTTSPPPASQRRQRPKVSWLPAAVLVAGSHELRVCPYGSLVAAMLRPCLITSPSAALTRRSMVPAGRSAITHLLSPGDDSQSRMHGSKP